VLGLGAAAVVAPWTSSILYGVAPWSSRSFFGATALVLAVAVFGTAIPFVRATRIEPAAALRQTELNCRTPCLSSGYICMAQLTPGNVLQPCSRFASQGRDS
jgi:hypothetical protein